MAMSFLFCLGKKIIVEEINVGRKLAKVTYTVIFALCNTQGLTVREQWQHNRNKKNLIGKKKEIQKEGKKDRGWEERGGVNRPFWLSSLPT